MKLKQTAITKTITMVIKFALSAPQNDKAAPMAKTTSFAITHFTVAFAVTYLLTGDLLIGGVVAIVEPTVNTFAYYVHEKLWQKVQLPEPSHS